MISKNNFVGIQGRKNSLYTQGFAISTQSATPSFCNGLPVFIFEHNIGYNTFSNTGEPYVARASLLGAFAYHIGHQMSSDVRDYDVEHYISYDVRECYAEHDIPPDVRNYYVEYYICSDVHRVCTHVSSGP